MARKPKIKTVDVLPVVECSTVAEALVDIREITGSRPLVRVTDDAVSWSWSAEKIRDFVPELFAPGAIVRIDPPADAEETKIDAFREVFVRAGASAVRVSARRTNAVLVIAPAPGAVVPKRVIGRDAVESLVESANVDDRHALKSFCEDVMTRAGL